MHLGFIQLTGPFTGGMNILNSVLQPNIAGTVSRLGIQSKIGNSYLITYSNNKIVTCRQNDGSIIQFVSEECYDKLYANNSCVRVESF